MAIVLSSIFHFVLLFYLLIQITTWSTYFLVVKPKAEEITNDLASYVEANNRPFTEAMLAQYVESQRDGGYLKDNEKVSIIYSQNTNDHRFQWFIRNVLITPRCLQIQLALSTESFFYLL
ncbi:hypothetical protein [Lysinibacillus sp. TE18511]